MIQTASDWTRRPGHSRTPGSPESMSHSIPFTRDAELLTRRPFLNKVLAGVEAARTAGLGPIKINAVLMRGINDAEASPLLAWALQHDYELGSPSRCRLMQITDGRAATWSLLPKSVNCSPKSSSSPLTFGSGPGPAERFQVRKRDTTKGEYHGAALGPVGIIASVTEPFCGDCRRTRITAEGKP